MGETTPDIDGDDDRRKFLATCGKFALVTPPAITLLLSTSLTSDAIAASGRGSDGGSRSDDSGRPNDNWFGGSPDNGPGDGGSVRGGGGGGGGAEGNGFPGGRSRSANFNDGGPEGGGGGGRSDGGGSDDDRHKRSIRKLSGKGK
jgi:hypothetical protein